MSEEIYENVEYEGRPRNNSTNSYDTVRPMRTSYENVRLGEMLIETVDQTCEIKPKVSGKLFSIRCRVLKI